MKYIYLTKKNKIYSEFFFYTSNDWLFIQQGILIKVQFIVLSFKYYAELRTNFDKIKQIWDWILRQKTYFVSLYSIVAASLLISRKVYFMPRLHYLGEMSSSWLARFKSLSSNFTPENYDTLT